MHPTITPTPQEVISRARVLAQTWIRRVCLWIENHEPTLNEEERDLWLAVLGVLGGFDTTLEGALQSAPAAPDSPVDADLTPQRKVEFIEDQLILVCSDIQRQMDLVQSAQPQG